jgi:hydrogenase maturation protease
VKKTLVLGLGNILLRDEALGVRVVERLQRLCEFPEDVLVIDGGTLGLDLLFYVEEVQRMLVIDAMEMNAEPGTIARLEGDEVPAFLGVKISPHQVGLADLMGVARLRGLCPEEVVLWGAQPGTIGVGLDLSPAVAQQVDVLADRALAELDRWGIRFTRRLEHQEGR